jgi:hypothetical protein
MAQKIPAIAEAKKAREIPGQHGGWQRFKIKPDTTTTVLSVWS